MLFLIIRRLNHSLKNILTINIDILFKTPDSALHESAGQGHEQTTERPQRVSTRALP